MKRIISFAIALLLWLPMFSFAKSEGADSLPDFITAHSDHLNMELAEEKERIVPRFPISESLVPQLEALQGLEARLPSVLPEGFLRTDSVSLRKMYGHITEESLAFLEWFSKATPRNYITTEHKVVSYYDVPVSMLLDIKYIGTTYVNIETGDEVMFIILFYSAADLHRATKMRQLLERNEEPDLVHVRSTAGNTYIDAVPSQYLEILADERRQHEPIVFYEISSQTVDVDTMREMLSSALDPDGH